MKKLIITWLSVLIVSTAAHAVPVVKYRIDPNLIDIAVEPNKVAYDICGYVKVYESQMFHCDIFLKGTPDFNSLTINVTSLPDGFDFIFYDEKITGKPVQMPDGTFKVGLIVCQPLFGKPGVYYFELHAYDDVGPKGRRDHVTVIANIEPLPEPLLFMPLVFIEDVNEKD